MGRELPPHPGIPSSDTDHSPLAMNLAAFCGGEADEELEVEAAMAEQLG